MDRSRLFSWSLGIVLLSVIAGAFATIIVIPFVAFYYPALSFGETIFASYGVAVAVLIAFFALVFHSSLIRSEIPKAPSEVLRRHPTASLVLFFVGLGYGILVLVGIFMAFIGGVGWVSSIFTAMLYPLTLVVPTLGTNSPWPILVIPLYLALPDIVITYFLFRWRAGVLAPVLGLLTTIGVLGFAWFFVFLAAAFG
jgi:hypothetical protein